VPVLEPVPPPSAAPGPRPNAGASSLRDGLQQLYAIRPSRDAYAEEAIRLIARGAGVKAAALLGYEQRGGRLQLLGHTGLEPEAVQVLSGDNMVSAWDIPLRSLRNRRINVIEAAHENPFVPKPLVAISPRRLTIAALPFLHANAPVGVVVLFSPTPRGFADGLLKTLSQSLRVCALALSELPQSTATTARAADEEPTGAQPNLLRGLAALKAELARLTDALDEAERQRATEAAERVTAQSFLKAAQERAAQLETELEELRAAQGRMPEVEAQVQDLSNRLHAAAEAAESARTQAAQLQASLAQHEQRRAGDAEKIAELGALRKELEQQLQAALDTARQRGEEAASLHKQVAELAPRAQQASDLQTTLAVAEAAKTETDQVLARLRQELLTAQDQRSRAEAALEQTSTALAANETDRRTLDAQLAEATARIEALAASEREAATLREQLDALRAEHGARTQELESARRALVAGGDELAAAAERAAARLAELEADHVRLSAELEQTRAQSVQSTAELREQVAALEQARRALEAECQALAGADSERQQLAARLGALDDELRGAREAGRTLEQRLAEQRALGERLQQERNALEARVAELAAGGQSLEQERQTAVSVARQRIAEREAEVARLSAQLDAMRNAAAEELNRTRHDAESTLDGLRVDLAETSRARDEMQRALAAAQQELAAHQRSLADMSAERARLEAAAEKLTADRAGLATRIESAEAERVELLRAREASAERVVALESELRTVREQQLATLQAQLGAEQEARQASESSFAAAEASYRDEIAELRDQVAQFTHEQERLSRALEEKDLLLQSAEENLTVLDLPGAGDEEDSVLDIDRDYAPERAAGDGTADLDAAVEDEDSAADSGEIVLFDSDDGATVAARRLTEFGHRVSALPASADASAQLAQRSVACAAVNLAASGGWEMLRHLRNGSGIPRIPLIAYALAANAAKGFWLGPVDFAVMPVAQSDLAEALNRMVPKVKRVIAMSNDIDVMSEVRTQLTGAGISTAVVLDGRQALDLVPTIRPEAAVLHLSPTCVDVFRAIAGLRSAEISRDIPILFLLDAEAQPREEAFLTAGLRMLTGRGTLQPDTLVDTLASAFDAYRAM
jgi:predicted  nucleic acid-binding Zn-ribbon protein